MEQRRPTTVIPARMDVDAKPSQLLSPRALLELTDRLTGPAAKAWSPAVDGREQQSQLSPVKTLKQQRLSATRLSTPIRTTTASAIRLISTPIRTATAEALCVLEEPARPKPPVPPITSSGLRLLTDRLSQPRPELKQLDFDTRQGVKDIVADHRVLTPFMECSAKGIDRLISIMGPLGAHDTILDVGCGKGNIMFQILRKNRDCLGIGVEVCAVLLVGPAAIVPVTSPSSVAWRTCGAV